jgi:hypothetical protein
MYVSKWEMAGFNSLPESAKCRIVLEMVRALVLIDMAEMQSLQPTPAPLYETGIRYAFQQAEDDWQDVARMLETGGASCNSLAAWRCAELRLQGYDARPYVRTQMGQMQMDGTAMDVFHVIVKVYDADGNSQTEDPSVLLGMPES